MQLDLSQFGNLIPRVYGGNIVARSSIDVNAQRFHSSAPKRYRVKKTERPVSFRNV